MIRKVLAGVVALILLGLTFYAGRVYQNGQDQSLFNAYSPPTAASGARTGSGARFGGAGGGFGTGGGAGAAGGQNSLVRAALTVGNPPGTKVQAAPASGSSGGASTGSSASGQLNRVVGSVTSIRSSSLSIQSFQSGTQSVALTPQTRFYQTKTASISALKTGEHVTAQVPTGSGQQVAMSITLGPAGLGGGGRRPGSGGGFGGGFGGVPLRTVSGTISGVGKGSIAIAGTRIGVDATTRINETVPIQAAQLHTGTFVTVSIGTVGGKSVAMAVVSRSSAFQGFGGFNGSGG